MNTPAELAVGHEIVSYCTKCKMDLGHTIMSMVKGKPARVVCRTCKSEHNFKAKKGVKDPNAVKAPKKPRAPKAEKTIPVEQEWMKQINASQKPLRHYATNETFNSGDKVTHPSFGEVIFKTDLKILIHAK